MRVLDVALAHARRLRSPGVERSAAIGADRPSRSLARPARPLGRSLGARG